MYLALHILPWFAGIAVGWHAHKVYLRRLYKMTKIIRRAQRGGGKV